MDHYSHESSSDSKLDFNDDDHHQVTPRPRLFRERENLFEKYDDVDFRRRFQLSKPTVVHLLEMVGRDIEGPTYRTQPIPALLQLLITLRFYATGTFQKVLGDHANISQSTVCRIIPRVTNAISALSRNIIRMPTTPEDRRRTMAQFYNICGFPGVIGAIDCTHIKIQSPGGPHAKLYKNRKGWFSYNVQAVCDANLKFTNLIARWPGSVHDSTIFNDSPLRAEFELGDYPDCYLLGDADYACKPYLLTPMNNPNTPGQQNYNWAHNQTRHPIERSYGVWKRTFHCLSVGMRVKRQTALRVIVATAVLHNIRIDLRDVDPIGVDLVDNAAVNIVPVDQSNPEYNFQLRNALIERVFNEQHTERNI